jgi:hypothetical protein
MCEAFWVGATPDGLVLLIFCLAYELPELIKT